MVGEQAKQTLVSHGAGQEVSRGLSGTSPGPALQTVLKGSSGLCSAPGHPVPWIHSDLMSMNANSVSLGRSGRPKSGALYTPSYRLILYNYHVDAALPVLMAHEGLGPEKSSLFLKARKSQGSHTLTLLPVPRTQQAPVQHMPAWANNVTPFWVVCSC